MNQETEDHLSGKHVVVTHVYADGNASSSLLDEEDEESIAVELWQDAAFTNGPPLVEIRLQWSKAEADKLRAIFEARTKNEEAAP